MHLWLKYYVMLRLMDRTKPKTQMQVVPMAVTFVVSAAWHGMEIGFFAMFIGFAFMEYFIKVGAKTKVANWIVTTLPFAVYHPVKWFYQYFMASYLVISFILMKFERFNYVHKHLYYFGHWALPLSCLMVTFLPKVRRARPPQDSATKGNSQIKEGGEAQGPADAKKTR